MREKNAKRKTGSGARLAGDVPALPRTHEPFCCHRLHGVSQEGVAIEVLARIEAWFVAGGILQEGWMNGEWNSPPKMSSRVLAHIWRILEVIPGKCRCVGTCSARLIRVFLFFGRRCSMPHTAS